MAARTPPASRPKPQAKKQNSERPSQPNRIGNRVRARRKELSLSLEELARRTDLTASFLSLIERDLNNPSLDSLRRIAEALEVPLFYFSESNGHSNPVVRREERVRITFPPGNLTTELLVPNLRNRLEVFIACAASSAGNIARTPKHDSEECIYLMEGSLRVLLGDGEYRLNRGDSIYFHGSSLREINALGKKDAVFISIITPPVL
jgi:transcriptional regulator with XRE-family HTH domain